jgi:hypothetical protein
MPGINKSEQRHFLAQVICTFKQGQIADRSAEAQQFRAFGLNLVIAAIVFWNSTYIADAIAHLPAAVQRLITPAKPHRSTHPNYRPSRDDNSFDPTRVLKSGAILVRQWRGHTHTVLVREDEFV